MKFFRNNAFKMDTRIYMVFILVVAIAIANALLSTTKIQNSRNTIYEITEYTNPTLEDLGEFNLLVTRSRMFISNWVYLPNNNTDKDNLVQLNQVAYPKLKKRLTSRMNGWRSERHVNQVQKLFRDYEEVIREQEKIMKSLVDVDDYQDQMKKFLAEEQLESEIIPSTNKIMVNLKTLITVKKDTARQMQARMLDDNIHLLIIVFSLAILIIVSVVMAGLYMMKKIIIPLLHVREVMLKMSIGELTEVSFKSEKNALGEMMDALGQLRNTLQRTTSFAGEIGRSNFNVSFEPLSDKDVLGSALLDMRNRLKNASEADAHRNWASDGFAMISNILHCSNGDIKSLSDDIISGLTIYLEAKEGVIYLVNSEEDDEFIELLSQYATKETLTASSRIEMNEGIVGRVVTANRKELEKKELSGEVHTTFVVPLSAGGRVIGAMQVIIAGEISTGHIEFIERISEPVASNILNLNANLLTRKLLRESQVKTRELAQQDEELRMQQEKLKKVNAELEHKALLLEEKNMTIEDAHQALAFKADQLEKSSKYKSDFLANMSHELRTPLNSVLILARLLGENKSGNMTSRQVEHAKVIHKSGSDLLVIINDILDLSKIEAGKLELVYESIAVREVCHNMEQLFHEVSKEKQITFIAEVLEGASESMYTDRVRLEQILKNLLSNAFKFTPPGGTIRLEASPSLIQGENAGNEISFAVIDTGIGIPDEKQKLIFDAFNQADSSITRRYGGTGLGLAICRQLTTMLGGEISLVSSEGEGSIFRITLPVKKLNGNEDLSKLKQGNTARQDADVIILSTSPETVMEWACIFSQHNIQVTGSNRENLNSITGRPRFVIIDDTLNDPGFIELVNLVKRNKATSNSKIICRSMSEYVPVEIQKHIYLHTTSTINPALAEAILKKGNFSAPQFREEKRLREVPVPAVSNLQPYTQVSGRLKGIKVLVADDDMRNIYSMTTIFENEGATVIFALDGIEAIEQIKKHDDIMVVLMDIMMPNMDGLQAMQQIRKMDTALFIPIIAVTAKAMQGDREICIRAGATEYITKPVDIEKLIQHVIALTVKTS